MDSMRRGRSLACEKSHKMLLRPNPIKQFRTITIRKCFKRSRASMSKIANDNGQAEQVFTYISEVLSCIHHGERIIFATFNGSGTNIGKHGAFAGSKCRFPASNGNKNYFSCFDGQSKELKHCFSEGDKMILCLETYTELYR